MDPNRIPKVKKNHETNTHCLICFAQSLEISFNVMAASDDEKIIEDPT